jgi:putative MATE family efflux protein
MLKSFLKFVIPSTISFFFTGIYVSIDGLFVGRAVGDAGLAAINLAWPIAAVFLAMGTGIGMGGAVNISNHLGAGRKDIADHALGNTLSILLIASILLTFSTLLFAKPLLIFMGAEGEILKLGYGYIRVLGMGAFIQVMGTGISPLLRNQNKPWSAMFLMISNFMLDTILSGVFVMILGFGVTGAAGASLIGEGFALTLSLMILFKKENRIAVTNYVLKKDLVKSIIKVGTSPFGLSFIPSLTIVIINWQAIAYGGTTAVAAYAVVSYILSTCQLLLQGIGDGSQPLISYHYGANHDKEVHTFRKWTNVTSLIIGFTLMVAMILFTKEIPIIFGVSQKTTLLLYSALPLCALSLPFYSISRVSSSFFYATKKSFYATVMIYSEVLIILPLCVIILPLCFQLTGVWIALIVTQIFLILLALFLFKRNTIATNTNSQTLEL